MTYAWKHMVYCMRVNTAKQKIGDLAFAPVINCPFQHLSVPAIWYNAFLIDLRYYCLFINVQWKLDTHFRHTHYKMNNNKSYQNLPPYNT